MSTLRVLFKGNVQSDTADLHGISQLSFNRMFMDVIDTMSKSLRNIHFKSSITYLIRAKADFMKVADLRCQGMHSDSNPWDVKGCSLIPILGMSRDAL